MGEHQVFPEEQAGYYFLDQNTPIPGRAPH